MGLTRMASRALLAGIFIDGGLDVLREPEPRAATAAPFIEDVRGLVPDVVPDDPVDAVRLNALVQVVAGSSLALGVLPRLSALALIGSLVPTTLGGHRFWELAGADAKRQRTQFLKNAAILGGLLLVAAGD